VNQVVLLVIIQNTFRNHLCILHFKSVSKIDDLLMRFATTELLNQHFWRLLFGFFLLYVGLIAFRMKSSSFARTGIEQSGRKNETANCGYTDQ